MKRFAVIFKQSVLNLNVKHGQSYKLAGVTFVDYDYKNARFNINSGLYKGLNNYDFDRVYAPDSFIFGKPSKVIISKDKSNFKIHIFDNKFITKLMKEKSLTEKEVYYYIVERLSLVKFSYSFKNIYHMEPAMIFDHMICPPLDEEQVEIMLYGNREVQKKEELVISSPNNMLLKLFDEENIKKEENISFNDIDIKSIIGQIENKIVGQEEAIKTLVSNIYYNQVLIDELNKNNSLDESELDSRKVSILLDGETGTGKTAIAKEIASKLNLPIEIVNANSFSETGYVGPTITDILTNLLKKTNGNLELAERGIVVLDEIDKIAKNQNVIGRDMKQGVQEELLSFVGGGKYSLSGGNPFSPKIEFNTSKLTFIMSGAFTSLKDKKIKEAKSKNIGFSGTDAIDGKTYTITPQDYIDYGLMREFFGRIKVLTFTKSYSKEDLKTILLKSEISPLKNFEKTTKMFGYSGIICNDEFIDKIVEEAYDMKTGARSLQTIMSEIQNKMLTDLILQNQKDEFIELDEEAIKGYQKSKIRNI